LNLRIIYSLFTEYKTVGPYELDWDAGQYKCELGFWITLSLLASLQSLNLFWLFFIVRIAYRLVVHNIAEDDRSDAEDTEADDKDGASHHPPAFAGTPHKAAATARSNGVAKARTAAAR